MTATSYLGKPASRVDGRAKVTGAAKYAAEYNVPGLAHGVVVSSAIAKGRLKRIHTADALAVAEEFEIARFAASLVRVEYARKAHVTDFAARRERAVVVKEDGHPPLS